MSKKMIFYAVMILFSFMLVEFAAFVGLITLQKIDPNLFAESFVDRQFDALSQDDLERYLTKAFDPELGWDNKPLTKRRAVNIKGDAWQKSFGYDGARDDGPPNGPLLVITYGDSFTECEEVNNDQTWQSYLKKSLGGSVKNYGVAAYGTDQALLKFKRHAREGLVAPITILGIYEENIARVLTGYQPFYQREHGIRLGFKPSFRVRPDGEVREMRSLFDDPALSLEDLRTLAKAHSYDDFWGRRMFHVRSPSVIELLRSLIANFDGLDPGSPLRLWGMDDGRLVMNHLVDDFQRTATKVASTPVILFIPHNRSLRGLRPPAYTEFKNEIRRRYSEVIVVDVNEQEFDRDLFNVVPYQGHASEYGNQVIARTIEEALPKHMLRSDIRF